MTRWHRPVRLALAVFAVGFAVLVASNLRRRDGETPPAAPARTDPTAILETTGATATQLKGEKQSFELNYQHRRTYEGGLTKLDGDVKVAVRDKAGRDFDLTGQEAEIADDQSHLEVRRDVGLRSSSGLIVRAGSAAYSTGDGVVRTPGPVTFESGTTRGSSVGATFDRNRDVLWLLDTARVTIDDEAGEPASVASASAGYARRDRYMRFEGGARLTRGAQVVAADLIVAYLDQAVDRIQRLELRGRATVGFAVPPPSGLDEMRATDMNLTYGEDGRTLQRATLVGGSSLRLRGADGRDPRNLRGEFIDVALAPDGAVVTSLAARENVQLDLAGEPARRIRSRTMEASGPPDQGIRVAHFLQAVEFTERPAVPRGAAPRPDRVVRSQTLDAQVGQNFASIDEAAFGGQVTIREGTLEAGAPRATYRLGPGTLLLATSGAPAGSRARVADEQSTIDAMTIDLTMESHDLAADADVRSVLKSKPGADDAAKRPAMLSGDTPVNVTAAKLRYDKKAARAVYTGAARLWQAETTVQGETLTLEDTTGNLTAKGSVRSFMVLEQENSETHVKEKSNTTATAEDLVYEDAKRLATYTTNARVIGPQGDLRADKIELFLDETGHALDRAEAYGNVRLKSEQRTATGARMTYFTADERYVMGGTPVRILEQLGPDCRETLGKTLTFYKSVDTINVDGNQESRTQTKSGGKCPEPPLD